MKTALGFLLGIVLGNVIYDTFRFGFRGVDWYRVAFVALVSFAVFAFIPFFRKKG